MNLTYMQQVQSHNSQPANDFCMVYLFLVRCWSFSEVFQNTDWQNLLPISHVLEEREVELISSWILKKHVLLVKYNMAKITGQRKF